MEHSTSHIHIYTSVNGQLTCLFFIFGKSVRNHFVNRGVITDNKNLKAPFFSLYIVQQIYLEVDLPVPILSEASSC